MSERKFNSFLAIDLGASSGRAILGTIHNDQLSMKEIRRFPNPIIEVNNHQYWDLFFLYQQVIESLKEVRQLTQTVTSVGIDTWGVDYVCFTKDGELCGCHTVIETSVRTEQLIVSLTKYQKRNSTKGQASKSWISIRFSNWIPNRMKRTESTASPTRYFYA